MCNVNASNCQSKTYFYFTCKSSFTLFSSLFQRPSSLNTIRISKYPRWEKAFFVSFEVRQILKEVFFLSIQIIGAVYYVIQLKRAVQSILWKFLYWHLPTLCFFLLQLFLYMSKNSKDLNFNYDNPIKRGFQHHYQQSNALIFTSNLFVCWKNEYFLL